MTTLRKFSSQAEPKLLDELQKIAKRDGRQFQAVLAGATVSRTAHFALHRLPLDAQVPNPVFVLPDLWMGAMVPKRWARRAVTRNTIKRQIYTVSSTVQDSLPAAAHVVRLRAGFDRAVFVSATSDHLKLAVREELKQLFARAVRP